MRLCRFEQCFLLSSRKRAHPCWVPKVSARDSGADISELRYLTVLDWNYHANLSVRSTVVHNVIHSQELTCRTRLCIKAYTLASDTCCHVRVICTKGDLQRHTGTRTIAR